LGIAFLFNRYSIPIYSISSSILIKEDKNQRGGSNINDYFNSSLLGKNINFQNELWILKSTPIIEEIVNNLDLKVTYFSKGRIQSFDAYKNVPFKISYLPGHPQPLNIIFTITFLNNDSFQIKAKSKMASFYNFESNEYTHYKEDWDFMRNGHVGELIETSDLAFIVEPQDTNRIVFDNKVPQYQFNFRTIASLRNEIKNSLEFRVIDKDATVIEIRLKSETIKKGTDIVNELMNVYSQQNLERKNHTARITIDYIEKQLEEISDSLSQTEDNLQSFRASNQLLNITDQAAGISAQYMNLQNQLAEMVSRKRYYDYVSDLLKNDSFSDMMLPASIGIPDQLLNTLMSELIKAQAQRSNLIENKQERNPMVQKLGIQIDNLKKTISENIVAIGKTTSVSIEEMNKRIKKIESDISRMPVTQRKLGNIERKYRLNDAIYNYMMEKHAEAKITQASNLPDDLIIESANLVGTGPIAPNKSRNYMIAFILGLGLPFGFLMLINKLKNKIETSDDIERLTNEPLLGKIMHNKFKTNNVMFEFSKSNIAESFRALRTNLDFYVRGGHKKIIMVTSCLEGEGKSFVALNLAMSYAQLGRKTILIDFDLRKQKTYFAENNESQEGLSSFMINKSDINAIIKKSPHDRLDYIPSGILPPNPVELLALDKTEELFNKLKDDYDIIVLDTTPLAQVTDAYLLVDHAEIKIIIVRQGFTEKGIFSMIAKDLHLKNIHNVCIVMNDNKHYQDQYGYGYGYYNKKGLFRKKEKRRKRKIGV
jgi:capsular exopolysaccharide synthesis family protein